MKILGMEGSTIGGVVKIAMGVTAACALSTLVDMDIPEFFTTKLGGFISPLHIAAAIILWGIYLIHKKMI